MSQLPGHQLLSRIDPTFVKMAFDSILTWTAVDSPIIPPSKFIDWFQWFSTVKASTTCNPVPTSNFNWCRSPPIIFRYGPHTLSLRWMKTKRLHAILVDQSHPVMLFPVPRTLLAGGPTEFCLILPQQSSDIHRSRRTEFDVQLAGAYHLK
ncbi:hypothetical protein JOM56_015577 [Amanita muscaria]